jgi:hypothetical protein
MQFNRIAIVYALIVFSFIFIKCDDNYGIFDQNKIKENKDICPNGYDETCKYLTMFKNTPSSINIETPSGTNPTPDIGNNYSTLFDSDINTIYKTTKTTKVRLNYDNTIFLKRMRVYGNTSYKFNVYYIANNNTAILIPSLCLTTQTLQNSWNTIWSNDVIVARSILLEIIPSENTNDGIREIEIWTERIPAIPKDDIITTLEDVKTFDIFDNDALKRSNHLKTYEAIPGSVRFS